MILNVPTRRKTSIHKKTRRCRYWTHLSTPKLILPNKRIKRTPTSPAITFLLSSEAARAGLVGAAYPERSHSTLLGTRLTDKSHSWLCVGLLDAQSGVIAENFARRFNRNSHAARRLGLLTQRASRMIAINDSASNVKQLDTMMIHKISAAPARSTCHVARTVVT